MYDRGNTVFIELCVERRLGVKLITCNLDIYYIVKATVINTLRFQTAFYKVMNLLVNIFSLT